jgi:hypothetical protein
MLYCLLSQTRYNCASFKKLKDAIGFLISLGELAPTII